MELFHQNSYKLEKTLCFVVVKHVLLSIQGIFESEWIPLLLFV